MNQTPISQPYKVCPQCQTPAVIHAPRCATCGRVYSTLFNPDGSRSLPVGSQHLQVMDSPQNNSPQQLLQPPVAPSLWERMIDPQAQERYQIALLMYRRQMGLISDKDLQTAANASAVIWAVVVICAIVFGFYFIRNQIRSDKAMEEALESVRSLDL